MKYQPPKDHLRWIIDSVCIVAIVSLVALGWVLVKS